MHTGNSNLQNLNVKNAVKKVSVQKYNHVYNYLSWDEIRCEKLLSLYPADKLFKGLADRVVRDLVLNVTTFQFVVTEEKQCSEETEPVYSVPSWDCFSCSFSLSPSSLPL